MNLKQINWAGSSYWQIKVAGAPSNPLYMGFQGEKVVLTNQEKSPSTYFKVSPEPGGAVTISTPSDPKKGLSLMQNSLTKNVTGQLRCDDDKSAKLHFCFQAADKTYAIYLQHKLGASVGSGYLHATGKTALNEDHLLVATEGSLSLDQEKATKFELVGAAELPSSCGCTIM
eukprot:gnl/Hemi2/10905_TR3740_c0_g1_i1.p3 gnl/Hemi2/10905_TR3740_c0_g1~~gnl/Hemi2/10905_TR3740_c0_g1_i1.p3  ORF type:complete len:172 (-),score=61.68 gnl/Hemi2/10905_TR3740_c0_g1_i1:31-546(-)